jgi:hypothetical protein
MSGPRSLGGVAASRNLFLQVCLLGNKQVDRLRLVFSDAGGGRLLVLLIDPSASTAGEVDGASFLDLASVSFFLMEHCCFMFFCVYGENLRYPRIVVEPKAAVMVMMGSGFFRGDTSTTHNSWTKNGYKS